MLVASPLRLCPPNAGHAAIPRPEHAQLGRADPRYRPAVAARGRHPRRHHPAGVGAPVPDLDDHDRRHHAYQAGRLMRSVRGNAPPVTALGPPRRLPLYAVTNFRS
jgi:hypothetical protein